MHIIVTFPHFIVSKSGFYELEMDKTRFLERKTMGYSATLGAGKRNLPLNMNLPNGFILCDFTIQT
jgi:hypothetical protein